MRKRTREAKGDPLTALKEAIEKAELNKLTPEELEEVAGGLDGCDPCQGSCYYSCSMGGSAGEPE